MKTLRRHPPLTSSSPTLLAPMHGPATIVSNTNLSLSPLQYELQPTPEFACPRFLIKLNLVLFIGLLAMSKILLGRE